MSNNNRWLSFLEYLSVGGSVVGLAIALVFQQAIYGLAPVSLSLVLNLINRRQLEQRCQQNSAISTQVQQLRSAVKALNITNTKATDTQAQELVPNQALASVIAKVETLNEQYNGLRLSLVPLQSRVDDLIAQFNQRPELEQIDSLVVVIAALKQCLDGLPQPERLQQFTERLQQLESDLAVCSDHTERLRKLEEAIAQMQQQLVELE